MNMLFQVEDSAMPDMNNNDVVDYLGSLSMNEVAVTGTHTVSKCWWMDNGLGGEGVGKSRESINYMLQVFTSSSQVYFVAFRCILVSYLKHIYTGGRLAGRVYIWRCICIPPWLQPQ